MRRPFFLLIVCFGFLSLVLVTFNSAQAATLISVKSKPVSWESSDFQSDDAGRLFAISGFSPLVADYQIKGGSEDTYINKLAFKVSNPAFVPAIQTFDLFYEGKAKKSYLRKLTVPANGIVKIDLKNAPIFVPRNSSTTFAVRLELKNDAGGVPSGTKTTVFLVVNPASLTLTSDFSAKTKSGVVLQSKKILLKGAAPSVFILRHAAMKASGACKLLECDFEGNTGEPTIAHFYFSAERSIWENETTRPLPALNSFKVQLEGDAISTGAGDGQVVVTVYRANYPEPIKLGEIIVPAVDNGTSGIGELVLANPLTISSGSEGLWFTVKSDDDDFSTVSGKDLSLNITGYNWSDGEATNLSRLITSRDKPVIFYSTHNRPKMISKIQVKNIEGVANTIINISLTSEVPVRSLDIFAGSNKSNLPLVKNCSSDQGEGVIQCEYAKPYEDFKSGYFYVRVRDSNGQITESPLNHFEFL